MPAVELMFSWLSRGPRNLAIRHREFLKFGAVGASTFVLDTSLFYLLKLTVLESRPVVAKVVAVLLATVASYLLNREWSFRARGGRRTPHEAMLYFLVSGIAIGLYSAPLWFSRYVLELHTPYTSRLVEEVADFTFGQIFGILLGMAFRWWAFRKFVFPRRSGVPHELTAAQRANSLSR